MNRPLSRLPDGRIKASRHKSGQALIESFGIMILLCLILFGVVQYVLMLTATEIVQYGADAGVRARAVGFNRFMVHKVVRVATIPNAGRMTTPQGIPAGNWTTWQTYRAGTAFETAVASNPRSAQYQTIEQFNIPLYLGGQYYAQLPGILDYEDWDTVQGPGYTGTPGFTIGVTVHQDYPLRMPFVRAYSDGDDIRINAEARLADHAELYLQ